LAFFGHWLINRKNDKSVAIAIALVVAMGLIVIGGSNDGNEDGVLTCNANSSRIERENPTDPGLVDFSCG